MRVRLAVLGLGLLSLVVGCGGGEDSATLAPETYKPVSFTTEDGLRLEGRLFGEGDAAVILAHMYPADQESWAAFALTMAQEGYLALTFNFRGYGDSEGAKEIDKIDEDLRAAVRFLETQSPSAVFLVGASMGGTASIKVAATERVDGLGTLSVPVEFRGLSAQVEISIISSSKLFIASEGDGSAAQSAQLFFERASEPKDMLIVEGRAHGTDMLKVDQRMLVEERILRFLRAN